MDVESEWIGAIKQSLEGSSDHSPYVPAQKVQSVRLHNKSHQKSVRIYLPAVTRICWTGPVKWEEVKRGSQRQCCWEQEFGQICRMLQINSFTLTFGRTLVILFLIVSTIFVFFQLFYYSNRPWWFSFNCFNCRQGLIFLDDVSRKSGPKLFLRLDWRL